MLSSCNKSFPKHLLAKTAWTVSRLQKRESFWFQISFCNNILHFICTYSFIAPYMILYALYYHFTTNTYMKNMALIKTMSFLACQYWQNVPVLSSRLLQYYSILVYYIHNAKRIYFCGQFMQSLLLSNLKDQQHNYVHSQ